MKLDPVDGMQTKTVSKNVQFMNVGRDEMEDNHERQHVGSSNQKPNIAIQPQVSEISLVKKRVFHHS